MVIGVGSTKKNSKGDKSEKPEELVDEAWMKLLKTNEDGQFSLKPWKEVCKANKTNLAFALRGIMRQAWGKYIVFHYCLFG